SGSDRRPDAGSSYAAHTIGPGMDARGFVNGLRERDVAGEDGDPSLAHVEVLGARDPQPLPLPVDLPEVLRARLELLGVAGLHGHQKAALDRLDAGENVIVATGTASGKTLVYNLAFARTALDEPKATALYVFPTKALARDQ